METENQKKTERQWNTSDGWSKSGLVHRLQIKETLTRWAVRFNRDLDGKLEMLVDDYSHDLKALKWTSQRFTAAAIRVTVNTRFFPQVADLVAADKELQGERRYDTDPTDDGEYERRTTMSDVHKIFFGIDVSVGLEHKKKNAKHDYPEYGPSLDELKVMPLEEVKRLGRQAFKGIG